MNTKHVVFIEWGDGFKSPPIGPFDSYAEARRFATTVRKRLRAAGRRWQGRIHTSYVASPERALSWSLEL